MTYDYVMTWVMFPAPAGMSPNPGDTLRHLVHVPRTRGDEPISISSELLSVKCSPHPRG